MILRVKTLNFKMYKSKDKKLASLLGNNFDLDIQSAKPMSSIHKKNNIHAFFVSH